ncbi:MAG: BON domain-containing protein [Desulfuromonadaceae bacterium]|nr:BON domain-containing protein [Desulfuromonadaceae bacterium]
MKTAYSISIMVTVVVLLAFSVTVHAARMDSRIESSAKQSYAFKTFLHGDDFTVHSKGGAVTLTGTVSENFHKALAQETVAAIRGVKSVDNRLEVNGASPTSNSDAWIRDKLKVALSFHRSVSAATIEVEVNDGIVTLRGVAASRAQKKLAAEYSADLDGVKNVINELTVSNTVKKKPQTARIKIDDASIIAQVNMTLLNHRSTGILTTTVTTKHGVVTVRGKATSAAEIGLVTRFVTDITGVKAVKNRMTVK